ncbi:MAG: DNA repair protein RadC [Clostridia bacterium]|nr:DNA repair protein RadC [Clostridia bacterium]
MADNVHKNHRARMREKFVLSGEKMPDHELLEIALFGCIPRQNTNTVSHALIEKFGSLSGVFSASVQELKTVKGIGENAAIYLKNFAEINKRLSCEVKSTDTFLTYDEIGKYFTKLFRHETVEKLYLLLFDKKGRIIKKVTVAEGDVSQAQANMKVIIENAASKSAYSAAIAHNHPSGILHPSIEDETLTVVVEQQLSLLGIHFIDHYVIADGKYSGIKENVFHLSKERKSNTDYIEEKHF